MELTGKIMEQDENSKINEAGTVISDEELDNASGGMSIKPINTKIIDPEIKQKARESHNPYSY